MQMYRLLYVSFAVDGFDLERNLAILKTARERNRERGITGVLLSRDALFLQVLEGPESAVRTAFEEIRRDPRHQCVVVLADYRTSGRLFPGWEMGFYHMSAIQAQAGAGLIGNDDLSLETIIERHVGDDPIAGTLAGFYASNARALRFSSLERV